MTSTFPTSTKEDYLAPNGITYRWVDNRWVVLAIEGQNLNALQKPYTTYVGDYAPTESVAEDKQFRDGELWYSTLTLELFCYGGGKWWPTAADFTGDIAALESALGIAEKDIDDLEESRVKKSGDDVSGLLSWNNATDAANEHPFVGVKIFENRKQGKEVILLAESGGAYSKGQLVTELEPTKETSIVNRKYVDSADEKLRQSVIELEEEINAIAPSVEYGTWEWQNPSNTGRPPAAGTFHLLDDSIQPTDQYKNTKYIRIHNDEYKAVGDSDPVDSHTWADADPGKLIQLYDAADPDFLLAEIVDTVTDEPSESVTIEVQLIQTSGVPNDNAVNGKYLTRINVFAKPSGGTADGFVLKTGDEMTGKLTLSNATAIDLKGKIQVNGTTTNSRFLGTDSYGNTSWKTALTSHVQADWNTTSTSSASYIKNKPTIPTINYTISKDSYGNYYVS